MTYYPRVEFNDLAEAIQKATGCSEDAARQAAGAAQQIADRHRGSGDVASRYQARYETLHNAVKKWSEAPKQHRAQADEELEEAAGISFRLSPRDDDA